jgi:hypothetical protein
MPTGLRLRHQRRSSSRFIHNVFTALLRRRRHTSPHRLRAPFLLG